MRRVFAVFVLEAVTHASTIQTAGGSWTERWTGSGRPVLIEVFGGHAEFSVQSWKQGWMTMQPLDQVYGTNSKDPFERKALLQRLEDDRVRLAVVAFRCKLWARLNSINYSSQQNRRSLRKYQRAELPVPELTIDIFEGQIRRGDDALRTMKTRKELVSKEEVIEVEGDMCRWNLRNISTNL